MNVLVLGATGMLGSAVFRLLSEKREWRVFGTIRSIGDKSLFNSENHDRLLVGVDAENFDSIEQAYKISKPNIVINCIGLIKQLSDSDDPLLAIPINALLPHKLAKLCDVIDARLIHISTDCVFSGDRGMYKESDLPDARDLYGLTKFLGEVGYKNTVTLRTSIIGPELKGSHGLLEWFLAQNEVCFGFTRAIFSGVPTITLAKIIRDIFILRTDLYGVYQIASKPISKFNLLSLISTVYGKSINIVPEDKLVINRSLDSTKFKLQTGCAVPEWTELIKTMYQFG